MTVRLPEGLPEDFDYSEPVNAVGGKKAAEEENGWGEGGMRGSSPVKEEERRARSPGKEVRIQASMDLGLHLKMNCIYCAWCSIPCKYQVRGRSPEKQLITANLSPARSESQIVSTFSPKHYCWQLS